MRYWRDGLRNLAGKCGPCLLLILRSHYLHQVMTGCWIIIKVLALGLFFAWAVGVPASWVTNRVNDRLNPVSLTGTRVTWSPLQGFILHRAVLADTSTGPSARCEADALSLHPDYRALVQGEWVFVRLEVSQGAVIVPVDAQEAMAEDSVSLLSHIDADIRLAKRSAEITASCTTELETQLNIIGSISYPDAVTTSDRGDGSVSVFLGQVLAFLDKPRSWTGMLLQHAELFDFSAPPLADIQFFVSTDDPALNIFSLLWRSTGFNYRGADFDGWLLEAHYHDKMITLDNLVIDEGAHRVRVEGAYSIDDDMLECRAYGDLSPSKAVLFAPQQIRELILENGGLHGKALSGEAWVGPCTLDQSPRHWGLWLSLEQGETCDVPIESAFVSLKCEQDRFIIKDVFLRAGSGPGSGTLQFNSISDASQRLHSGDITVALDLRLFKNYLPGWLRNIVHMFDTEVSPLSFNGSFSSRMGVPRSTEVHGNLHATNLVFRGASLTGLDAYLAYSNEVLQLNPAQLTCGTGAVSGSLRLDFGSGQHDLDVTVTTNPRHVAPVVSRRFAEMFQPYRFSDDILLRITGRVDVLHDAATDLQISASGRNIGVRNIVFDRLSFASQRGPGWLSVTNATGSLCDGVVTGRLNIVFGADSDQASAELYASDISMSRFMPMLKGASSTGHEGRLSFSLNLAGPHPDTPLWTNWVGAGSLRIKDGRLLTIPLFGGLSTLLGKIYPGLGFSEQNLAEATFIFRDGGMYTDDLKLEGGMVSLAARGRYTWDDRLDFKVQVRPFRDGSVASAVRLVTLPLSKLLEFKVKGSLGNPLWQDDPSPENSAAVSEADSP